MSSRRHRHLDRGHAGGDGPPRIEPGPARRCPPSTRTGRRRRSWSSTACTAASACPPARPTSLWGEEMDSPRGRIHLMSQGLQGEPLIPDSMVEHFDACLGCMACVTACPSGVQYDKLIEATRAQVERNRHALAGGAGPARGDLRALPLPAAAAAGPRSAAAYQGTGLRRLAARERCAAAARADAGRDGGDRSADRQVAPVLPERVAGPRGRRGCTVGDAHRLRAARVLPRRQRGHRAGAGGRGLRRRHPAQRRAAAGRCRSHNGREAEAQAFARKLIDAFAGAGVDGVVVNAAGCGSSMKEYAELLADDPAYADRARRLRGQGPGRDRAPRRGRPGRAAAPAAGHGRLPRRLPPRPRPGHPQPAPGAAAPASPDLSSARSPTPSCAAGRPASTTCSNPGPARELG